MASESVKLSLFKVAGGTMKATITIPIYSLPYVNLSSRLEIFTRHFQNLIDFVL